MSDIFLSYASEDVEHAGKLAQALSRHGWSVWWDRSILPGKIFDAVIEAELSAAKCVIVLWTTDSVESRWVRAEAGEALDKGRLIPVLLEEAAIPLVFRQIQAATLIGWDGEDAHAGFQHLLKAVGALAPPHTSTTAGDQHPGEPRTGTPASPGGDDPGHRRGWWALVALLVVAVAGGTAVVLRDNDSSGTATTIEADDPGTPPIAAAPTLPPGQPTRDSGGSASAEDAATAPAGTADTPAVVADAVAPAPPAPPDPAPPRRDPPPARPAAPVAVTPAPAPERAPRAVAAVEPAPAPPAPATPLRILAVAWAMPSDDGTASASRVKEYSTQLSRMMSTVVDEVVVAPVRFDYHYPDQQEYYRLLKDRDGHARSKGLCSANSADLVIAGFVKGAELVSVNFGFALTRNPVFSVYDCTSERKIEKSYQVAERVGDRFPFEQATTAVFRRFVQEEAALAGR
jgi:hypothetical protein